VCIGIALTTHLNNTSRQDLCQGLHDGRRGMKHNCVTWITGSVKINDIYVCISHRLALGSFWMCAEKLVWFGHTGVKQGP
jgi:hypothetical protein